MTTITFDTQEAVIKLKAVGVSQEQADAFVNAIVESQNNLATKDDLHRDLLELENRLIKWIIGIALGQIAIIAALVKLL
jgi:hypothetical protein